jgi:hypothetical protein
MQMRVDDEIERARAQCVLHECARLRRVRRVSAIDERGAFVIDEKHVV